MFEQERAVIVSALKDFDSDEWFDVLECKHVPNKDNLVPLLAQMGHKAIIQAPMYVIECWRPIMVDVRMLALAKTELFLLQMTRRQPRQQLHTV